MDGKKIHMLVLDDEKIQRDGVLFLLKKSGLEFEISQCENGEEAYRLIKKEQVDILLTDILMPFMDGMELISRVAPLAPDTKIILYSGYEDFECARTAIRRVHSESIEGWRTLCTETAGLSPERKFRICCA